MNKNIMKLFLGLLTFVLVLSSCYKEDTQILYSRQYVIPSLTAWRDSVNNRLDELQEGLNKIVNQEPVSNLTYVVSGGDTVGVNITLGTKTVFVPYGKNGKDGLNGKDGQDGAAGADGKDGQSYEVTMGENGNWFINGQDTGKPWRGLKGDKGDTGAAGADGKDGVDGTNGTNGKDGVNGKDGLTPTFGIKQDTDGNFYWTIAWPGTAETYILSNGNKVRANGWDGADGQDGATGAQGPQGPAGPQGPQGEQGIQGTPGVDSPLREVTENDTAYVFKVQYPGQPVVTYTIPKTKQLGLYLYPQTSTQAGAPVPDRYDADKNLLTFKPGEEIAVPYTKSDELGKVVNNLPQNWKVRVDETEKKIYITAPSFLMLTTSPHGGQVTVMARTAEGLAYQREVEVQIEKMMHWDFYYTFLTGKPTSPASSPYNEINLYNGGSYAHFFAVHQLENGAYKTVTRTLLDENISVADRITKLKQTPYVSMAKTVDYASYAFGALIYNKDSLMVENDDNVDTAPEGFYVSRKNQSFDAYSPNNKAVFVNPVPWDTYGGYEIEENTGDGAYYRTIRLRRLSQTVRLEMKDPHKWFKLDASEPFDASRVVLYHGTSYGRSVGNAAMYTHLTGRDGVRRYVTTKAEKVATYDAATKMLTAQFTQFPTTNNRSYKLYVQYTTSTGQVITKVTHGGLSGIENNAISIVSDGGSTVVYYLDVPQTYGANNLFESSIAVMSSSGKHQAQVISQFRDVAAHDDF